MVRRSHVATKFICVATGNRHYIRGKHVATQCVRQRVGHAATRLARTRQGTMRAIELFFCHDRGFAIATDFSQWLTTHCVCALIEPLFMDTIHGYCSHRVSKFWFPVQWDLK